MSEAAIYLDHAATTACRAEVVEAMLPYFGEIFGNPSGIYRQSRLARRALDTARAEVAAVLNCQPREIVFTSGGSESDNLALKGTIRAVRRQGQPAHLIVSAVEHHAVLHAADELAAEGVAVTHLPVDPTGQVTPAALLAALRPTTTLVSVMLANNEVGTINPIAALAAITRPRGILLHCDAVQAAGQLSLDCRALGCDLLSLSAHKFGGPKGVGLLYWRSGATLLPQQQGGTQEGRRRAGTEPVASIVGLATALRLAEAERPALVEGLTRLRQRLIDGLGAVIPALQVNGHAIDHLPSILHLSLPGCDGESLVLLLDGAAIAASTGSACTSGSTEASHVLLAMGRSPALARTSLRLSLGRTTTALEVERVITTLPPLVAQLRTATIDN